LIRDQEAFESSDSGFRDCVGIIPNTPAGGRGKIFYHDTFSSPELLNMVFFAFLRDHLILKSTFI